MILNIIVKAELKPLFTALENYGNLLYYALFKKTHRYNRILKSMVGEKNA